MMQDPMMAALDKHLDQEQPEPLCDLCHRPPTVCECGEQEDPTREVDEMLTALDKLDESRYPSLFTPDSITIWALLEIDEDNEWGLQEISPLRCVPGDKEHFEEWGHEPPSNFLEEELLQAGWDSYFGYKFDWLNWALLYGIAPWQPFQIRFWKPVWFRTSYEYSEYDATFEYEVLAIEPWRRINVYAAWLLWQKGE